MKFALIAAKKADYEIAMMCRALSVSRSGYYAWHDRPPSRRAREDIKLGVLVRESHERSKKRYGSPRVHDALAKAGVHTSRKRVARLMREKELVARPRRGYKHTTDSNHKDPIAPNLLNRDFTASAPNQRWVGDTTELYIGPQKTKLYLAAIVDLFSRFVVGWAISTDNDRFLTLEALKMAVGRRCPEAGLLHHSDRGSTYTSGDYQDELKARSIVCSMSRKGNCYDNAAMESWFSTLKAELGERFESNRVAQAQLFEYIETDYNVSRSHSSLGYETPKSFETNAALLAAA